MSLVPPFLLLDRYDVTDEIGHGGHAIVYRAHDRLLDREVAVKLLRDESLSPDTIARFRQEVQVTAQLEHAHILHVYDTGAYEGRPYIVMELATGRTLAERLAREGQLPLADALQIARDVGLALAHAHARGVVHRDVKPENILMGDGGAILADFGIARVTQDILAQKITSTGTTVGTVQYMSPEQLCAEPNIDARTDQYSLACVLYEMLAGVRPHIAATFEGLRLLRMTGQHVPVSAHRPSVPDYVDDAIATALSPMAADRFRTMEEMLAAIGVEASGEWQIGRSSDANRRSGGYQGVRSNSRSSRASRGVHGARDESPVRWWTRGRAMGAAGGGVIALAAVAYAMLKEGPSAAAADGSTVFAIAESGPKADTSLVRLRSALRSELAAWTGVRVIPAIARGDTTTYALETMVVRVGDSLRVRVSMRRRVAEAITPRPLERLVDASEFRTPERLAAALAPQLMLRSIAPMLSESDVPGVDAVPGRSVLALQKYVRGFENLRAGQLDSAARRFREAAVAAPGFANAEFWAAQSGAWASPAQVLSWQANAESAARGGLRGLDSLLASALNRMALSEFLEACADYRKATSLDTHSFTAWYGLGECQRLDSLVVRRPEGYRFRSSHWSALEAYKHAVDNAPTATWLSALFSPVMKTTYAMAGNSRAGHTGLVPRDSLYALPSLAGDTIGFVPIPASEFSGMGQRSVPVTLTGALRRGRAMARDLTARWLGRFPKSPDAWFQRAVALELAGQIITRGDSASADDALERAELGAPSALLRARIAVARTRLALRRGDISGALDFARSATSAGLASSAAVRATVAPLAALLGDAGLATRLSGGDERALVLPAGVADSLRSFDVRATLGDCHGLADARLELERLFNSGTADAERHLQREELLHPVYRSAVPCLGPDIVSEFAPKIPLDQAYASLAAGNRTEARRQLASLRARRAGATYATISWDYLYAESWALVQAGDTAAARTQLGGALDDIASMSMYTLDQMAQAAGLRRGLLLFVEIARASGAPQGSGRWVEQASHLTSTINQERPR